MPWQFLHAIGSQNCRKYSFYISMLLEKIHLKWHFSQRSVLFKKMTIIRLFTKKVVSLRDGRSAFHTTSLKRMQNFAVRSIETT